MSKTLNMVGGGAKGLFASIFATGVAQSDTVTLTTPSGKVKSGVWSTKDDAEGFLFEKLGEFGTYTLSASNVEKTVSKEIVVDTAKEIEVFIAFVGSSLDDTSWEIISAVSNAGKAQDYWRTGDKKTISVNGVNYDAQIIGFDHDEKTSGGKAGITFQLVDCLNDTYPMNSEKTNVGGWGDSDMNNSTMDTLFNKLSVELQNVINPVNKLTSAGNKSSTIETVSNKLFIPSEVEVFGTTDYSFAGEGEQYEYYKAGNSKVKKVNGTASSWNLRSPSKSETTHFCAVISSGTAQTGPANSSYGVSFCFCV